MNFYKIIFERVWNWLALHVLPDDAFKDFRIDDGQTPAAKTQAVKRADSPALTWKRPSVES